AVLTFRNLHNWLNDDAKNAKLIFDQSYLALKPGGLFGIVEHRANPGTSLSDMYKSGYVTEELTVKLAKQAGFELIDKSEVNKNSNDTKDYSTGVWTLPPTYYLKDLDRDKYKNIGESDRMTLLFQKPL
ncbi:MAG: methyltransferase, partial [Pseudomonadota bacterium]|nr:methyltransferase [Pseudomonadota bacterium]